MDLQDPFRPEHDIETLLALYAVYLLQGNTHNNRIVSTKTIKSYLAEAAQLATSHNLPYKIDWRATKSCSVARLIADAAKFQDLPARRRPLTRQMIHYIICEGQNAPFLSFEYAMFNWLIFGCHIGPRLQEWGQDSPNKLGYHVAPDETEILKAFCRTDIIFYDKLDRRVRLVRSVKARKKVVTSSLRFRIQKNRQNNQQIPANRNEKNVNFCLINAELDIVRRAELLGQPDELPLAIYQDEDGGIAYITGYQVTAFLRKVARKVHPSFTDDEISLFSTHSLRVTAAVLLHEAGKDPTFIKQRLRWLSNCFEIYLRNTGTICDQHNEAFDAFIASMHALNLGNPFDLDLDTVITTGEFEDIGEYEDTEKDDW